MSQIITDPKLAPLTKLMRDDLSAISATYATRFVEMMNVLEQRYVAGDNPERCKRFRAHVAAARLKLAEFNALIDDWHAEAWSLDS